MFGNSCSVQERLIKQEIENNKTNNHGRVHVQNVVRDFPRLQLRQA